MDTIHLDQENNYLLLAEKLVLKEISNWAKKENCCCTQLHHFLKTGDSILIDHWFVCPIQETNSMTHSEHELQVLSHSQMDSNGEDMTSVCLPSYLVPGGFWLGLMSDASMQKVVLCCLHE